MRLKPLSLFILLLLSITFLLAGACSPAANAAENPPVVKSKGYIDHAALVATTKPTRSGATTKGWVGNKSFKLKTTTRGNRTTTKGWVDGKYVKVKTKKD
jgi:hypothetical protein